MQIEWNQLKKILKTAVLVDYDTQTPHIPFTDLDSIVASTGIDRDAVIINSRVFPKCHNESVYWMSTSSVPGCIIQLHTANGHIKCFWLYQPVAISDIASDGK